MSGVLSPSHVGGDFIQGGPLSFINGVMTSMNGLVNGVITYYNLSYDW